MMMRLRFLVRVDKTNELMATCKRCDRELEAKQTSYCSLACSRRHLKSLWQKRRREVVNKAKKKWRDKTNRTSDKNWYIKYPEKSRAHKIVRNALMKGELVKENCKVCNSKESQAHHEDYSKPLDVIWFCALHHTQHHVNKNKNIYKCEVCGANVSVIRKDEGHEWTCDNCYFTKKITKKNKKLCKI